LQFKEKSFILFIKEMINMFSTVSVRGQTVIPVAIRKRHGIQSHTRLQWIDEGDLIVVVPIHSDPIAAFRGKSKGKGLLQALLKGRQEERENERRVESQKF
jgi:bifunctional DNA-binding transcriptional regulator/antitoxin component of YhaV-PrlF toxin-antitoxin module